jgi:predicted signal transduction protein with EAL and GGDEF domain
MVTTNGQVSASAADSSSRYNIVQGSPGWLSGRRRLVVGAAIATATTALALGQHWLAVADLVPLLFVLPCAVMMFHCMKGMKREAQTDGAQTSLQNASNLPASEVKPTEPAGWAG